jgi:hypothetical protein
MALTLLLLMLVTMFLGYALAMVTLALFERLES